MREIFENLTDELEKMSNERSLALANKEAAQFELTKISAQMGSQVSELERLNYIVDK